MKENKKEKQDRPKKTGSAKPKKAPGSARAKKKNAPAAETPPPGTENIEQWRKDFVLERRQEIREKQRQAQEQEQLQMFLRRTKAASGKKARKTVRTRAFYRFSKAYPSNVDQDGFRENAGERKRGPLVYVLCALLVFCLSFIITKTCLMISKEAPAAEVTEENDAPLTAQFRALRFSYDAYAYGNADAVADALRQQGCNTALFEVKPASGYVNLSMPEVAAAGKREVNPEALLSAIRDAGFQSCAYISCFQDPLAAQWDLGMAVRRTGDTGEVWTDNAGVGWLNPFSTSARTYLTQIVEAAAKAGFDYILLDNVCFSADSGASLPYYPGEQDAGVSRNGILNTFVSDAVKAASGAHVIVMCRYSAFDPMADPELPSYGGNLLQTAAGALCVDVRLSFQQKNILVGTERFADVTALPFVFTLAAGDYAAQGISDALSGADCMICVEKDAGFEDAMRAVALMDLYGYIIW